jgi:hypothetical protein
LCFRNYHSQNLLNQSVAGNSADLIGANGLNSVPSSASNLIDSQTANGHLGIPSSTNDATVSSLQQQVMAMQHHYPSTHFSPYHQLPPASVAAAAFGQAPNAGMIGGGQSSLNGQGGFVGNPLQGVGMSNTILPRYSLSHPASGKYLGV